MVSRALVLTLLGLGLSLPVGEAWAQADPKRDPAAAEALFKRARTMMDQGNRADACPMFAESYRLDAAPGTLLNIAECHRLEGKTATAWGEFLETAREFRRRNDERRAVFADGEAKKLEPELAYVRLSMVDPPEGLTILRGGISSTKDSLGAKLPIDPGPQVLKLEAPGKLPIDVPFTAKPKDLTNVLLPPLADKPPEPEPTVVSKPISGRMIAGLTTGAFGIAAGLAGGVTTGFAWSKRTELEDTCPNKRSCSSETYAEAELFANLTNVLFATGAAAFTVGLVIVLTEPGDEEAASEAGSAPAAEPSEPTVSLRVGPLGLGVEGRF